MLLAAFGAVVAFGLLFDQFGRPSWWPGTRAAGWFLFAPLAFLIFGVIALRLAVSGLRPWLDYRATTVAAQREADRASDLAHVRLGRLWVLDVVAFALLAGVVAALVVLLSLTRPTPLLVVFLVEIGVLCALVVVLGTARIAQVIRSRNRRDPNPDNL